MTMWLRLFVVVVAALFRRKLAVIDESVLHFVVLPNDIDANMHMNNARYLAHMDLGRVDYIIRCGLGRHLRRERVQALLGSATVRFSRSLKPFERFTLRTRVIGWDEKWFYVEQSVDSKTRRAATAVFRAAFRGSAGTIPPEQLLAVVGHREATPPLPLWLDAWAGVDAALER